MLDLDQYGNDDGALDFLPAHTLSRSRLGALAQDGHLQSDLLKHLDRRLPRYTSYPTAVQFDQRVGAQTYAGWLAELAPERPVSVYLHIPFCAELCLYCGCHTTVARRYAAVAAYVDLLEHEIELVGRQLGNRRMAVHIHWGGGTPTILSAHDFLRLMKALRTTFVVSPDCETAIEIDPRTLPREFVAILADAGINRASLGVQDFEERVQKAVGRMQSYDQTARAAGWLREAGIRNLSLDLMYGLPYQTKETVAATTRRALTLEPDRIAMFGYAHVPWMKRHQKLLPEEALPGTSERLAQSRAAAEVLVLAGYRPIGLDHFAKHDDVLACRQQQHRLHRNFQGYTTDEASVLIGLGTSAISTLPQGYAQNASNTVDYRGAIDAGCLATMRGCALTDDDRLRRQIIEQLMCNLQVDVVETAASWGKTLDDFSGELADLNALAKLGIVRCSDGLITVPEHARPFVRTICAVFDAYLSSEDTRFSRAM